MRCYDSEHRGTCKNQYVPFGKRNDSHWNYQYHYSSAYFKAERMGIFSLELSKPLALLINSDDEKEINAVLKAISAVLVSE